MSSDTPKSEKSERTIALGERLASELFDHRARTVFEGDDERVFCSQTGGPLDPARYAATLRLALAKAKVDRPLRPFHDGRHTSITNAAAAGTSPGAPQPSRSCVILDNAACIDLAGEAFREEAELLERRLLGVEGLGRNLPGSATFNDAPSAAEEVV